MSDIKFSKNHEWVKVEGDDAIIGITKHATEMLGDIVFVEVPEKGKQVESNGQTAIVESTKAASDVYSPLSGEIIESNQLIADDTSKVNADPEGDGWFFKIKIKDKTQLGALMTSDDYEKFKKENPS